MFYFEFMYTLDRMPLRITKTLIGIRALVYYDYYRTLVSEIKSKYVHVVYFH